jgi:hypothetical protein
MAITSMNQLIVGMFNAPAGNLLAGLEFVYGDDFESAAADLASAAAFPYASVNDMVAAMLGDSVDADTLAAADAWADTQTDMAAAALVAVDFLLTTEDEAFANARAQFENKVTVAAHYSTGANMVTFTDVATSQALIASVTSDAASVTAITEAAPAPVEGSTFTLTDSTTADVLVGTNGSDTFSGDATTYADADRIIDASNDDADVLNLTVGAAANPDVSNVETLNVTMNAVSAIALDASAIVGAEVLNIQRGDLSIGGTTVTGNKAASVTNVDASQLPKVVAGDAVTSLNIDAAAADKAGLVVDATGVTGNVTVDGASTITANESTGTVAVDAATNTTAAETVKATTIDAAAAATVTTHADLTGAVTINAAKASTITVNDGQGGVTVNGGTTSTADTTITVVDIDASGATITTGTGSSLSAEKEIDIVIDGTAKTTDAASIVAGGTIDLDIDGANDGNVDILTLSGNGSDVTYRLAAPTPGTFTSLLPCNLASNGNLVHSSWYFYYGFQP